MIQTIVCLVTGLSVGLLSGVAAFANHGTTQKIFFVSPADGATITGPVKVKMGLEGMKIRPAGEDANDKKSGHYHILVDQPAVKTNEVIPADEKHLHFGKGQTETELNLPPGDHTLTLQLADGAHRAYDMSTTIKVHVEATKK